MCDVLWHPISMYVWRCVHRLVFHWKECVPGQSAWAINRFFLWLCCANSSFSACGVSLRCQCFWVVSVSAQSASLIFFPEAAFIYVAYFCMTHCNRGPHLKHVVCSDALSCAAVDPKWRRYKSDVPLHPNIHPNVRAQNKHLRLPLSGCVKWSFEI